MEIPNQISPLTQDDLLTPKHSIPSDIHSLNISGSKGHFSSNFRSSVQPFDRINSVSPILKSAQTIYDELYQDAAKRNMAKDKISSYASLRKEKEAEGFKSDRRLTKAESFELFNRLNREAEIRQERLKISKRIKEDQELKVLKSPSINKSNIQPIQDVVTRLLQYGENTKRKNQDRMQKKKELEEEELRKIPSVHKRVKSDSSAFSNFSHFSTPGKDLSFISGRPSQPYSSPDKIIQKIQNLSAAKATPFNQRPSRQKTNNPLTYH